MYKLSTATLLALTGVTAIGAQAANKLEETVITSSRVVMPLREVATSISVVTKEDIELRGFSSVAKTLQYEPAISVTSAGGVGSNTEVRIRGERGFRTKVYLDGIDLTDASSPQAGPNFGNMLTGGIDRIEVLRGPEGLMYGADAGGVINMYSASPQSGLSGGLEAEGGRYGTWQYGGHITGGNDTVDGTLLVEEYETDGFSSLSTDTVLQDDDGYKNTTVHGRGGWNIIDTLRLEVVARNVEGKNNYDNCSLPAPTYDRSDNCKNEYSLDAGRIALVHTGTEFSNTVSYNGNKTDRKFYTEGVNDYSYKGELEKLDYLGSWKQSDALSLVYGAEYQKESVESDTSDESRDQTGYFLEARGSFIDSLYLSAGARYTDNDDFGSKTTYRLGAAYVRQIGDGDLKVKSTYGTGFRAPSLSEIAFNASPDAFPPAQGTELGAEESKGWDAGIGYYATSGWYVDAVYFDQKVDNEIFFDLVDYSGYLQGDGESSSSGVEITSQIPIGELVTLTGNYTYTDTQDFEGDQRLRTPKNMGNVGILISPWDGRLQFNINYRVARDTADESKGSVDDYEILDLSVTYQVIASLQIYARVENATDEDYEVIPQYNTPGAAGYAGFRYQF
ncbi:Vitamin B12 transporter BtuB [Halioglobus japonicus]|nr:Vitamin B12 transporter BtuB [Halioglobus japonicus]